MNATKTKPVWDGMSWDERMNRVRKLNRVRVRGTYSPNIPCTHSCKSARGDTCICSCAGDNHGTEAS